MILRLGGIVTQASGSMGGITISNRRGVQVASARPRRCKQNTVPVQEAQQNYLTALAAYRGLPALTQLAWKMYCIKHPVNNRLGITRRYTPQQLYLSQAIPRLRAGLGTPGSPPGQPQQSIGVPSTMAFTSGGPYTFEFYAPTGAPTGFYLLSVARTTSTTRIGRLCFRALPAYTANVTVSVDIHDDTVARIGELQTNEIAVLSIRYAGTNAILSAPIRWQLTVT